jgi:uncharacterized protein
MAETLISPGVLARENDSSFIAPSAIEAGAAIIGPAVKGPVEIPTLVTSYGDYQQKFGTTFTSGTSKQEYLTSLAVKSYFNNGGNTVLMTRVVSGSFTAAANTPIVAESGSAPFTLETLGKGTILNSSSSLNSDGTLVGGTADNIRYEISNVDTSKGTFSLSIRRGDDATKGKVILESFNDLSLDPVSDTYIEKVIGNQAKSINTSETPAYISTTGEYVNRSKYIRVASVTRQTLDYLANDGLTLRDANLSGSLPTAQEGAFHNATGNNGAGNFFDEIDNTDTQGLGDATAYADAISVLGNKDEYVFNIISVPGLIYSFGNQKTQIDSVISLAEERGDAIAVVDVSPHGSTVSGVVGHAAGVNSSYTSTYWPWLQQATSVGSKFVPASVVIPGVYAFTDGAAAPWFAPAGLTRGGLGDVIQAERKLTRVQRDSLYAANVNPIATFPGAGISVFGQKTLQKKKSALDRVNVRRLLIDLKKFVGDVSRTLVFEQNTNTTRNNFLSQVNPFLESVVQRQGLYAYRVVMDDTNNTADVIDRNQLIGQIFIQPAKTVEFIVLDFAIEPTGATFGG